MVPSPSWFVRSVVRIARRPHQGYYRYTNQHIRFSLAYHEVEDMMDRVSISRLISSTPPRCLRRFRVDPVPMPVNSDDTLVAAWRLVCSCGATEGAVLGHPLSELKPGYDDELLFVSPFSFQCPRCGLSTEFLDTAADGTGAELAKLKGAGIGCAAYRGEGPGKKFSCSSCGTSRGEVVVELYFNEDYMVDLEKSGIEFPFENLFSGVHVYSRCSECNEQSMVTEIDTKY